MKGCGVRKKERSCRVVDLYNVYFSGAEGLLAYSFVDMLVGHLIEKRSA
jgi:hypothetical protein